MGKDKTTRIENVLAALGYASMFLPVFFMNKHHNCHYEDECLRIWYEGKLGVCVEDAIDNLCLTISVFWWFIIIAGCLILNKYKNAISPFVVISMVLALALFIAFIDPSKWKFFIALSISATIFIIAAIYDSKTNKGEQV